MRIGMDIDTDTRLTYRDFLVYLVPGCWFTWSVAILVHHLGSPMLITTGNDYADGVFLLILAFIVGHIINLRGARTLLAVRMQKRKWGHDMPEAELLLGKSGRGSFMMTGGADRDEIYTFAKKYLNWSDDTVKLLRTSDSSNRQARITAASLFIYVFEFLRRREWLGDEEKLFNRRRFYDNLAASAFYSSFVFVFVAVVIGLSMDWSKPSVVDNLLELAQPVALTVVSFWSSIGLTDSAMSVRKAWAGKVLDQAVRYSENDGKMP